MKEYVNTTNLLILAESKGWSVPELASKIEIDYSYLTRVLNKEKPGGAKLITGVLKLCLKENLDYKDYIFLDLPLSVDNKTVNSDISEHSATLERAG